MPLNSIKNPPVDTTSSAMYSSFAADELTLRDALAIDRTIAANERTVLGYVRTTLALLGGGAALLHFFDDRLSMVGGWALLGLALPTFVFGIGRYVKRRRALGALLSKPHALCPDDRAESPLGVVR